MHIFIRSLIESANTLIISIICSVIFTPMIHSEYALYDIIACTVLNTAAFALFLYLNSILWARLYRQSSVPKEYLIPTFTAFCVYAVLSSALYFIRFPLYMWFFLPTRFLEPQLASDYATLTLLASHGLFFALIFLTRRFCMKKKSLRTYR